MKLRLFCVLLSLWACHEKPAVQSSTSSQPIEKPVKVEPAPLRSASKDGWRWQNPSPVGHPTLSIWARSLDDFYAVGDAGTIFHYEKGELKAVESGTRVILDGVFGTDDGDVFVVGAEGVILRSQKGGAFVKQESGTTARLWGVWGSSSKNVYAVGDAGTILRFDGTAWSKQTTEATGTLSAITGRNAKDIYVAGEAGTLLRFDGEEWSQAETNTKAALLAVGIFGSQVVACGASGTLLRSNDGFHFTQDMLPVKGPLLLLFAAPDKGFLATGPQEIVRFDGKGFSAGPFTGDPLLAAVQRSDGGLFATATGRLYKRTQEQNIELTQGTRSQLNDITFDKDGKGTIASEDGIYEFDGAKWSLIPATKGAFFEGVSGTSVGDLAVGPAGLIIRKSASGEWLREDSGTNLWLTDVYIASHANVFVVGHKGTFLQREESTESWKQVPTPTSYAFAGISGKGPEEVYLVGEAGTIYRYDGKKFQSETSPIAFDLKAVSCEGKDILAVGKKGSIIRRTSEGWVKEDSGVTTDLFGVFGLPSGEAYAVGDRGLVLYRSAQGAWSKQDADVRTPLLGIAKGKQGVVIVGVGGAILTRE